MPISVNSATARSANRQRWARQLQKWGLAGLASSLLESNIAFAALAAQGLYVGQPLLSPWVPREQLHDLADMLEHPEQTADFTRLLHQEAR